MSKRITTARLLKAGFVLTDCPDGKFWVIERHTGSDADSIAAICKRFLEDMEDTAVSEDLVLQCDSDFKNPVLYVDGFLWELPRREFAGIVARLTKASKKAARSNGPHGNE